MGDLGWVPVNPFEDSGLNVYQFMSTLPMDVNQFLAEVSQVTGTSSDDLMVSSTVSDSDSAPSESNPMTVWLASRVSLDTKVIQPIIDGHIPDPPEPVATLPTGVQIISDDPSVPAILVKLRAGTTLTTKELSAVLASIVGG